MIFPNSKYKIKKTCGFMKEERKIQQMGNAFTVYLPTSWLSSHSLARGSTLFLSQTPDGSLILSSKKKEEIKNTEIRADEFEEAFHSVISAYIAGATEIFLTGKQAFSVASKARVRLGGIEIVGETAQGFRLKVFLNKNDFSQDDLLKRMHSVTTSMIPLVSGAIEEGKNCSNEELESMDDDVDRLHVILLRLAYQNIGSIQSLSNPLVAKSVERACDHIEQVGLKASSIKPIKKEGLRLFKQACTIYQNSFQTFLENDSPHKICEARSKYRKEMSLFLDNTKFTSSARFADHCLRIVDYASDIAEIAGDNIQYSRMENK